MDQDRQNSLRRDARNTEREQDFTTYRTAQSSNDMVPTVFRRGVYRTIRGSLKRFLSIVVITALGVSVMCGLKAGCEDLCDSVDAYFDQQNVYDINVQSTYGLTRDDLAAIQEVDGVETAEGIYTETAYTAVGTTRERVVVQSLSKENIDQPVLVNGDLPESADEVAVTSKFLKASGKKIGDTVSFAANDASSSNQSAKDQFAVGDYTITAEVLDPTDVSSDSTVNAFRAASTADYKFYVSEDAATSSSYSAVHVIVEGAKSLNSYSDAYAAKINEVKGNIEKIREERENARAQELTVDTPASLDAAERQAGLLFGIEQDSIDRMAEGSEERAQAQAELDQRRAAADQQFADARAELSDSANAPGTSRTAAISQATQAWRAIARQLRPSPRCSRSSSLSSPCSSASPPPHVWSRRSARSLACTRRSAIRADVSCPNTWTMRCGLVDRRRARQHHRLCGAAAVPVYGVR